MIIVIILLTKELKLRSLFSNPFYDFQTLVEELNWVPRRLLNSTFITKPTLKALTLYHAW